MAYESWSVEWDMPVIADDRFNRWVYYSWGGNWLTPTGGTVDNYNVDGSRGTILSPTGDTSSRNVLLPGSVGDFDAVATFSVSQVSVGANINEQFRFRSVDGSNFYLWSCAFDMSGNVDVAIIRVLAGSSTTLVSSSNVVTYEPDSDVHIYVQCRGSLLRAKIWIGDQDEPPSAWTLETTDANHPAGQVGIRALLSGGNTNINPVVRVDNLRVWVPERWVNITSRVDTAAAGPYTITSGDTPEASADTGGFGLPVQNHDQAFTPGNTLSPHAPNITPGSRIRVRETIGDRVFERGTGYVQYPEIAAWTESNQDAPRDQLITIPVVDRAAWIAQGRTLVSTLAEHVIYHGGTALRAYWPMGETEGPDVNPAIGGPWTISQAQRYNTLAFAPDAGQAAVSYGGTGVAPADELGAVTFEPSTAQAPTPDYVTSLILTGTRPAPLTLAAGQVLTVVCWTRPGELVPGALVFTLIELAVYDGFGNYTGFVGINIDADGNLVGYGNKLGSWSGTVTGPPAPTGHSMPIAVRVGFSPAVLELWVRGEVYPGVLTVGSALPLSLNVFNVAERYPGAVNHAQVYLGDAADWSNQDFVAQHEMGLYGMERQTTGERIRTMLTYAGVDPSELGRIDDGASLMQAARLAGRNPMDLIADAVATEQGEFWIDGGNRPVFADRIRLYNV